jgi:Fe-S-cluster containining protein
MGKRGQGDAPWYRTGLQFSCTGCGSCCSGAPGYVWVTEAEIAQLAQAREMTVEAFRDQFIRRVGLRESLIEYSDGDCIFLDPDSRKCMVYDARPTQCRTWPFWDSNVRSQMSWEKTCEVCPGAGQGKLYTLQQIEMARLRSLDVDDSL